MRIFLNQKCFAPASHQLHTSFASHQLRASFAPASRQLRAGFAPASRQLRIRSASRQLRASFAPASRQLRASFAPASHQLRTSFAPASRQLRKMASFLVKQCLQRTKAGCEQVVVVGFLVVRIRVLQDGLTVFFAHGILSCLHENAVTLVVQC